MPIGAVYEAYLDILSAEPFSSHHCFAQYELPVLPLAVCLTARALAKQWCWTLHSKALIGSVI